MQLQYVKNNVTRDDAVTSDATAGENHSNTPQQAGAARVPQLIPITVGPFEVLEQVGEVSFRLKLPSHWRVHDVFHVS